MQQNDSLVNGQVRALWPTPVELAERLQAAAEEGDADGLRAALDDGAAVDQPAGPGGLTQPLARLVILLYLPLPLVGASIRMERGCQ